MRKRQYQPLALTAVAALTFIGSCVYPTYNDEETAVVEEQMSVWQYLKIYSIYHERLPKAPGSLKPSDMFDLIHDTLHGVRYTDYIYDGSGGGGDDSDTEFYLPKEFTRSTVYFYLPEFSEAALELFNISLPMLSRYRNIIIDVRYNPGGYLKVTDSIMSDLLPYGTQYIKKRGRNYNDRKFVGETVEEISRTAQSPRLRNKKLVVLMNGYSASASEILIAGLKDGAGARLVGSKSYGKGIGQVIIPKGDRRQRLKITNLEISGLTERTGQYHRVGIEPDTVPKQIKSDVDAHVPNARQLQEIQDEIDDEIEEILAEDPTVSDSVISEIREQIRRQITKDLREVYYALKILQPELTFVEDDEDGEDGDDADKDNGAAGGTGKRRSVIAGMDAKSVVEAVKTINSARTKAKTKWRPMGAVVIDEKDLPNIELPDD